MGCPFAIEWVAWQPAIIVLPCIYSHSVFAETSGCSVVSDQAPTDST